MKKILLCVSIIAAVTLAGCSKDDDSSRKFPKEVKEVLAVLNGKFVHKTVVAGVTGQIVTMVFTPFTKPTPKFNILNDVPLDFDGAVSYHSIFGSYEYDQDQYFYINVEKKQIVMYITHEKPDYFNVAVSRTYDYKIIDENTFELHDVSLSQLSWNTFYRQ